MLNAGDYSLAFRNVHVYVRRVDMSEKTQKRSSKKKARSKTVFEFSAGGVVARAGEALLVWARDLKGRSVVTLPKGLVKRGEASEEAALREVREETGFRCRIVNELPKSEYFYRRSDKLVRKTVRWFLMEPIEKEGGHDHESALTRLKARR
jgi:8-oxo-dGTP pyrophosphatase MutT (NUDIX family)